MKTTGYEAQRSIPLEIREPFIRTAVQSMMLETVDIRFNRCMLAPQRLKVLMMFPLIFLGIQLPPLRQNNLADQPLELFIIPRTPKTLIKTDAVYSLISVDQFSGERNSNVHILLPFQHSMMKKETVLIGGNSDAQTSFHYVPGLPLFDPFCMRFEQRKDFLSKPVRNSR